MATAFRRIFQRKKQPPLVCAVDLDHDPAHHHSAACFVDFEPLAVVELFQSQGCSACPPAIPGILDGVNHPNLALLSYNVTIFDHLGWKDTHGSLHWDRRQRTYMRKWGRTQLFTPMVVANGVADGPGAGGPSEISGIVQHARNIQKTLGWHIYVDANDNEIRVDSDRTPENSDTFDIMLAIYNAASEKVRVRQGPNKGKKIEQKHIVQELIKVGEWNGGNAVFALPMALTDFPAGTEGLVFVQGQHGGPIVGATKL